MNTKGKYFFFDKCKRQILGTYRRPFKSEFQMFSSYFGFELLHVFVFVCVCVCACMGASMCISIL
jgi:hypothetical protein